MATFADSYQSPPINHNSTMKMEKNFCFQMFNNFLWCINRQCSKAETCLRQLAERLSPEELISRSAINPKHLAKFKNECPYFCSNKQVRYA